VKNPWTVRLSHAAEHDFQEILRWTAMNFGQPQAMIYAKTLSMTLGDLINGPEIPGVQLRQEIGHEIYTLQVARKGRKGRHFIVFRTVISEGKRTIDVLRLLHDSMDLQRHLPPP
jgi:toxin ParE1/3/4